MGFPGKHFSLSDTAEKDKRQRFEVKYNTTVKLLLNTTDD